MFWQIKNSEDTPSNHESEITMSSSTENFRKIAEEAERNLNTYEAKTGAHKTSQNDEAGVDTRVKNQFPGAQVRCA